VNPSPFSLHIFNQSHQIPHEKQKHTKQAYLLFNTNAMGFYSPVNHVPLPCNIAYGVSYCFTFYDREKRIKEKTQSLVCFPDSYSYSIVLRVSSNEWILHHFLFTFLNQSHQIPHEKQKHTKQASLPLVLRRAFILISLPIWYMLSWHMKVKLHIADLWKPKLNTNNSV